MICPKCKKENEEGSLFCSECGFNFTKRTNLRNHYKLIGYLTIIGGLIVFILFVIAGMKINVAGINMSQIRSVSGNSIAEVYYQNMGIFINGFAILVYALGICILIICLCMGITEIKKEDLK